MSHVDDNKPTTFWQTVAARKLEREKQVHETDSTSIVCLIDMRTF